MTRRNSPKSAAPSAGVTLVDILAATAAATGATLFCLVSLPLFIASLAYCDKKVLPDFRWKRTVPVAAVLALTSIVLGLVLAAF